MKLLDQVINQDGSYTVRVWQDEVAPDAIGSYDWVKWDSSKGDRAKYEASQIQQALALSALVIPQVTAQPKTLKADQAALAEQAKAVEGA